MPGDLLDAHKPDPIQSRDKFSLIENGNNKTRKSFTSTNTVILSQDYFCTYVEKLLIVQCGFFILKVKKKKSREIVVGLEDT